MEQSKELVFKVMVTFPGLLEKEIVDYNKFHGTDFEMIEVIDDEVPFCKIGVSKYKEVDLFGLGYSLAVLQYTLREKGEIDW